jgi:hypothetical protein
MARAEGPWVSGSRGVPSVSVAVDVQDEVFRSVRGWVAELGGWLGVEGPVGSGPREEVIVKDVGFLSRFMDRMLSRPTVGAEFGKEMSVLFSTGLRLVKDGPLRSLLLVPCAWCGCRSLMQQEGVAGKPWYTACEVRLGGCGRLFTEDEMAWMAEVRLAVGQCW